MPSNYFEYQFTVDPKDPWEEILLAQLTSLPFESFDLNDGLLKAYVPELLDSSIHLDSLSVMQSDEVSVRFEKKMIPPTNWNAQWESSFQPIIIGNECAVRADFHPPMGKKYELVITPKMSFGTGHHETTQMMLAFALDISMTGKEVLDMGCGTGVLGILSAMKGAKTVHAIDNDPWCVENTIDNAERNRCTNITVELADSLPDNNPRFDLIFANINRNVLLDQLSNYAAVLNPKGILLLSGFYQEDVAVIQNEAEVNGLSVDNQKSQGLWGALKFTK